METPICHSPRFLPPPRKRSDFLWLLRLGKGLLTALPQSSLVSGSRPPQLPCESTSMGQGSGLSSGMVCPKTSVRGRCSEVQPYLRASQVLSSKESACQCRGHWRCGFSPWVGKFPRRRAWRPTPLFLPGESLDKGAWQTTVHDVAKS